MTGINSQMNLISDLFNGYEEAATRSGFGEAMVEL